MADTTQVAKKFDLHRQYDVFGKWLEENGFTLEDLPLTATTETRESVMIWAYTHPEEGLVWQISTLQENGVIRINHYYKDGTVEELYER